MTPGTFWVLVAIIALAGALILWFDPHDPEAPV